MHLGYFRAGADCGITASYQATIPGLTAKGYSRQEAEDCIARSVELFREARESWWAQEGRESGRAMPLCLGPWAPTGRTLLMGPSTGATTASVTTSSGTSTAAAWRSSGRPGPTSLLIETQPSLHEALIEAEIAEELGADYWISFSCRDGDHIHEGDRIADCAAALSQNHPHLRMIGVNCTAPQFVEHLIGSRGVPLPCQ